MSFKTRGAGDEAAKPMKNARRKKHLETGNFPLTDPEVIAKALAIERPTTEEEWAKHSKMRKIDANDIISAGGREAFIKFLYETPTYHVFKRETPIIKLKRLWKMYPSMNQPIIDGLLRRGEIMNVISSPKSFKSWMGLNLAMSIISGGKFFGRFDCTRGKVLVIDNEIHPPTIVSRTMKVSDAMNVPYYFAGNLIDYICCRGDLIDVLGLRKHLEDIRPKYYSLIILDALYKFYPEDFEENSNSDMARLYTILDMYADACDSAIAIVHHTSKFGQSGKQVVDVGAGAGSLARACDAHLVVRPMQDEGVFRIDAVTRSFPPIEPFCASFKWPVWELNPFADPDDMLEEGRPSASAEKIAKNRAAIDEFLATAITKPMTIGDIVNLGYTRGFKPWSRTTLNPIIFEAAKTGKMRLITAQSGRQPATYQSQTAAPTTAPQPPNDEEPNFDSDENSSISG